MDTTDAPADRVTFFLDEANGKTYYGTSRREITPGYRITPHLVVVSVRHDSATVSTAMVRRDF
jgi:hypothetical protein